MSDDLAVLDATAQAEVVLGALERAANDTLREIAEDRAADSARLEAS